MAIIIPSSNIYSLDNNKVIDNKIDGVSYEQTIYDYSTEDLWNSSSSLSSSSINATISDNSQWYMLSKTERQRLHYIIKEYRQSGRASLSTNTNNIRDWNDVILEFNRTASDAISSTSRAIKSQITGTQKASTPTMLPANSSLEAINFWADMVFKTYGNINITNGTTVTIFLYYAGDIKVYRETEQFSNGEWTQINNEIIYDTNALSFISYHLYSRENKSSAKNIAIGNTNSAYSLPNLELFTSSAKINGKTLGTYVAEQIIENYKNGKETAEVLCSISNYYDELGNQVKFDNGEDMVFDIYDVVVPMKYTQNGEDVPISITTENNAKTFVVLGVEIFYDGSVWQRLTLAEYGYILSKQILKPNISIDNNLLYISSQDNRANNFDILINGVVITNTAQTIFDLTTLALDYGTYSITVIAKANDYDDSLPSNSVNYTKLQKYYAPIISLEGSTLTITDIGSVAKSFEILVDNIFVASTTNKTYDLETLSLAVGSYSISVIAKADGYESSDISNIVNYVVVSQQLQSPSISIDGNTLTITDSSLKAQQATIFINDIEADTVSIGDGSGIVNLNEYVRIVGEYSIYVIVKAETYIDSEISNIVEYVVYATEGLKYAKISYSICMGIGTATDTDIVISQIYDGLPVKEIYDGAFAGRLGYPSPLTSISIPSSETTIETNAFSYCSNLTDIYVAWEANAVAGAPWGAKNATIHYNAGYDNAN